MNDGINISRENLAFIGVSRTRREIKKVLERQAFQVRKNEFIEMKDKIKSNHLRKGKKGDWKYYLSAEMNHSLIIHCCNLMNKFQDDTSNSWES